MPRVVVPFHQALPRLSMPGGMLPLEEARARMEHPPAQPVEWIGTCDGREARTYSQLWHRARAICAAMLGVSTDRVKCVRADEQRLNGTGVA